MTETSSNIPGVHFLFSRSVPKGTHSGNAFGCAPILTTITFLPGCFTNFVISKYPAVKHPKCSPAFLPLIQPVCQTALCDLQYNHFFFLLQIKISFVPEVITFLPTIPILMVSREGLFLMPTIGCLITSRVVNLSTSGNAGCKRFAKPGTATL